MLEVTEKSTAYLTVNFFDKNEVAAAPSGITYRVDCEDTGAELVPDTAGAPGTTLEITIPSTANAIQDPAHAFETKLVTVTATYGVGDQLTGYYRYRVRNLSKIN